METNCKDCPLRLFNTKGYPIKGKGTTVYGNIIIIPTIDKNAYKNQDITFDAMVQDMIDIIHSSTGGQLLDFCYITSLVKCTGNKRCPITPDIADKCFEHFIKEFNSIPIKHVLFLGKNTLQNLSDINAERIRTGRNYCNCRKIRDYSWNYSPGVKYYDDKKFEIFKQALIDWYNYII